MKNSNFDLDTLATWLSQARQCSILKLHEKKKKKRKKLLSISKAGTDNM